MHDQMGGISCAFCAYDCAIWWEKELNGPNNLDENMFGAGNLQLSHLKLALICVWIFWTLHEDTGTIYIPF